MSKETKSMPSSIDAPSPEFMAKRSVVLELMDDADWRPRLRANDQTQIDRLLKRKSIALHQAVGGWELMELAHKAYGSLVRSSMGNLDRPIGGSGPKYMSRREVDARRMISKICQHIEASCGRPVWEVVEAVAIYDKSVRQHCRDAGKTNRSAASKALQSGLSEVFNYVKGQFVG